MKKSKRNLIIIAGIIVIVCLGVWFVNDMNKIDVKSSSGTLPKDEKVSKLIQYSEDTKDYGIIKNGFGSTYGISYKGVTFSTKKMDEVVVGKRKELHRIDKEMEYKNNKVKITYTLFDDEELQETSSGNMEKKDMQLISINFMLVVDDVYIQGHVEGNPFPKAYQTMNEVPEEELNKLNQLVIQQLDETVVLK